MPGPPSSVEWCEFEVEVIDGRGGRFEVRLRAGRLNEGLIPALCYCPEFADRGGASCEHVGVAWCCVVYGGAPGAAR